MQQNRNAFVTYEIVSFAVVSAFFLTQESEDVFDIFRKTFLKFKSGFYLF